MPIINMIITQKISISLLITLTIITDLDFYKNIVFTILQGYKDNPIFLPEIKIK